MVWFNAPIIIFILIQAVFSQIPPITPQESLSFAAAQFPETKHLDKLYDFIIVGAGSAGCMLANRLSAVTNWKILVLEAGGFETLSMDVPGLAINLISQPTDWKFKSTPYQRYGNVFENRQVPTPRGKVVGGSSAMNFMITTRGQAKNYDQWASQGCSEWSYHNILKYFEKIDQFGPPSYKSDFAQAYYNASLEYGFPATNLNDPNPIGIDFIRPTTVNGTRMSANRAYLMPIRNRHNLHLKTKCLVTKIIIENRKAIGVKVKCLNTTHYIYVDKEVIVSAGAINSPKLLMLSGVGNSADLEKLKINCIQNLPVGNNLIDHASVLGLMYTIPKPLFTPESFAEYRVNKSGILTTPGAIETITYPPIYNDDGQPALEYFNFDGSVFDNPKVKFDVWNLRKSVYNEMYRPLVNKTAGVVLLPTLLKPKSRGQVKLKSKNPFADPLIDYNYLDHPDDVELLLRGIKHQVDLAKQPSLVNYGAKIFDKPLTGCKEYNFGTDNYWRCHIRNTVFSIYHPCCTNRMGLKTHPSSVVDCQLNVIGIKSLRIIDSSIMPEIPGAHLNIPTMMIAAKGADLIKLCYSV